MHSIKELTIENNDISIWFIRCYFVSQSSFCCNFHWHFHYWYLHKNELVIFIKRHSYLGFDRCFRHTYWHNFSCPSLNGCNCCINNLLMVSNSNYKKPVSNYFPNCCWQHLLISFSDFLTNLERLPMTCHHQVLDYHT
jgi:hypothetical protein